MGIINISLWVLDRPLLALVIATGADHDNDATEAPDVKVVSDANLVCFDPLDDKP